MSSPSFKRRKSSKATTSSTRENTVRKRPRLEVIEIDDSSSGCESSFSVAENDHSSKTGKMKAKNVFSAKKRPSLIDSPNKKDESLSADSPATIKLSRERRLNKRRRERSYDEVEKVVNMSEDDTCDVSEVDKIEAYKMRGSKHNTGGEDENDLLANNLKCESVFIFPFAYFYRRACSTIFYSETMHSCISQN